MKNYTCIDLFAGAGGLSYGFLEANQFVIKLAIENDKYAQETYKKNHPTTDIKGDINEVDFRILNKQYGNIDVIIGGPPCQGFSNANRQHNYLVSSKNQLIKKYIEAIELVNPQIIVMENVKTIASSKHKFLLTETDSEMISDLEIEVHDEEIILGNVNLLPQEFLLFLNRIKLSKSIVSHLLPEHIYVMLNQLKKNLKNIDTFTEYYFKHRNRINSTLVGWDLSENEYWCSDLREIASAIKNTSNKNDIKLIYSEFSKNLLPIIDSQKIYKKLLDIQNYNICHQDLELSEESDIVLNTKSYKIIEYIIKKIKSLGYNIDSKVLNAADFGVPQLRKRFILLGIKEHAAKKEVALPTPFFLNPSEYLTISDAIKDLENYNPCINMDDYEPIKRTTMISPVNELLENLSNTDFIYNHIITDSREDALSRFKALKPGQNFHDLADDLKSTYTEPSKTQNTIYKRLQYDLPSDTVVNVRKSMWIHPTKNRAISIREAARLQSFPDSFIFCGTKDAQYQQIGNAVPPLLGKAIAEKILDIIT